MTQALIANCLEKMSHQLADIRLCVESLGDGDACLYVDSMEYEFAARGTKLTSRLNLRRSASRANPTWNETQHPLKFLSNAFSRIHDHLSSLRSHGTALEDSEVLDLIGGFELGVLKTMRKLRLHLNIPYDWHEKVGNVQPSCPKFGYN